MLDYRNQAATYVRRAYQRFEADISGTLIFKENIKKLSIIRNLSARGAGLITNYSLETGERLNIIIRPSFFSENWLYKEATVAWCEKVGASLWQGGLDFSESNKIIFDQDFVGGF